MSSSDRHLACLPELGEQITFEDGDCRHHKGRITVRITDIHAGGYGMINLVGSIIDSSGFPNEGRINLAVSVATVEARRLHRRKRT